MNKQQHRPVRTTFVRLDSSFALYRTHLRNGAHFAAVGRGASLQSGSDIKQSFSTLLHELTHSLDDGSGLLTTAIQELQSSEQYAGFGAFILNEPVRKSHEAMIAASGSVVVRAHFQSDTGHIGGETYAETQAPISILCRSSFASEYSVSPADAPTQPYFTMASGGIVMDRHTSSGH